MDMSRRCSNLLLFAGRRGRHLPGQTTDDRCLSVCGDPEFARI